MFKDLIVELEIKILSALLTAVAAFATGGVQALADQNSEAAKLLLTQIKK